MNTAPEVHHRALVRLPRQTVLGPRPLRRLVLFLIVFGTLAAVAAALSATVGTARVSLRHTMAALLGWVPWVGPALGVPPSEVRTILLEYRLPRVALAGAVGLSLSVSGAALQGLLGNPLADPYIVGVSAGAAVGASAAILAGLQTTFHGLGVPAAALVGALAALLLVIAVARTDGRLPVRSFLLAGVVVGSFCWSLVTLLLAVSGQSMQEVMYWLLGSLSGADRTRLVICSVPSFAAAVGLWLFSKDLNLISLGEEPAHHLGVRVETAKAIIIVLASLATASAVAVSGVIGFVGLVIPHITRSIVGPDHRVLLPSCGLLGAAFLMLADTAARTLLGPTELPVGVLTALLGAPFFCYVLRARGLR
ncbi:MAG: FecCD family ABC transporter permease [Armatimonadota bacterium]